MPDSISVQMLQFTWGKTAKNNGFCCSDREARKKKLMSHYILMLSLWKSRSVIGLNPISTTEGEI